jgi:hypothetical protein
MHHGSKLLERFEDKRMPVFRSKMRPTVALGFAVGLICVAQAGDCRAQEQQSFKTLLGKGFEIKGVTFAHGDSTDNRDAFLVTLQKDKSVAVCYFASANWINLTGASLDDARRCEVR